MAEAIRNPQQEYWHPPAAPGAAPIPVMATVCGGCGAEFMVGAHFCHVCGRTRLTETTQQTSDWTKVLGFVRIFEFQHIRNWIGLPLGSLVAFLAGIGCLVGALVVGLVYSPQTSIGFEALQLWRMQWLLGAVAAFLAGILLKRPGSDQQS